MQKVARLAQRQHKILLPCVRVYFNTILASIVSYGGTRVQIEGGKV